MFLGLKQFLPCLIFHVPFQTGGLDACPRSWLSFVVPFATLRLFVLKLVVAFSLSFLWIARDSIGNCSCEKPSEESSHRFAKSQTNKVVCLQKEKGKEQILFLVMTYFQKNSKRRCPTPFY